MKFKGKTIKTKEIVDESFYKFSEFGDNIKGILVDKEESGRYGFGLYTILQEDDNTKRIHGTTQLDQLLMNVDINTFVDITYIDDRDVPNGTMKLFKVEAGIV